MLRPHTTGNRNTHKSCAALGLKSGDAMVTAAITCTAQPQSIEATAAMFPMVLASMDRIVSRVSETPVRLRPTYIQRSNIRFSGTSETRMRKSRSITNHTTVVSNVPEDRWQMRTPPDVGIADASSAIDMPTQSTRRLATSHCSANAHSSALPCSRRNTHPTHAPNHRGTSSIGQRVEQDRSNRGC